MCVAFGPEGQRERKTSAMALAGWPQPHPRAEMQPSPACVEVTSPAA